MNAPGFDFDFPIQYLKVGLIVSLLSVWVLIGLASEITAGCFYNLRRKTEFIGAGLLAFGFTFWGIYLATYPFMQRSEQLISSGFFISAVLQLFIAVSMIVLVLEEVRQKNQA